MEIGKAIKAARESRKIKVSQVAKSTGMDPRFVYRVESGDQTPSLDTCQRFAAALDVKVWKLIKFAEERISTYE